MVDVACSIRDSQWIFLCHALLFYFWPVTITFHSSWLDKILGQVMSDLYHVLLDLGTGDYQFPAFEYHIVYVRSAMFTKHSRTLKLFNSRSLMFSPRCLYNNLQCLVGPTILCNGHKKNAVKSWHNFLIYICRSMSHSKLPFFGIINLIVHVPWGRCLDRDFCCEIVPSLSLGHYLAQHQSLSRHSPLGNIHY